MARKQSAALLAAKSWVGRAYPAGWCQKWVVAEIFQTGGVGDYDGNGRASAIDGWKKAKQKVNVRLQDAKKIPAGLPIYFLGGKDGHAAVSAGNGMMYSTDLPKSGRIGLVPIALATSKWGYKLAGYVTVEGNGHNLLDGPPAIRKPSKAPAAGPKHSLYNMAGFDSEHGQDSWDSRVADMVAEIKDTDSDVWSLLEVPNGKVPDLTKRLDRIGLKVAVVYMGRVIAVKKALRVGRTLKYRLPEKGPSNDTRYVVYAEVFFGAHAWMFSAGHFEHRPGDAYDETRVIQARQALAKGEEKRKAWGIDETRMSYADDENSNIWVLDRVYEPAGFVDVFDGAYQSVNESTGTNPGWVKTPPKGERIDKIKRHKDRPVRRAHVRKASAGRSDHLITTVTYGKI